MLPFFAVAATMGSARAAGSKRPPGGEDGAGVRALPQKYQPAAIPAARRIAVSTQSQRLRGGRVARGRSGCTGVAGSGVDVVLAVIVSLAAGPIGQDPTGHCQGLSMIRCRTLVTIC